MLIRPSITQTYVSLSRRRPASDHIDGTNVPTCINFEAVDWQNGNMHTGRLVRMSQRFTYSDSDQVVGITQQKARALLVQTTQGQEGGGLQLDVEGGVRCPCLCPVSSVLPG